MNTTVEILLEQVYPDGWDTGFLKEVISFRSDPNVDVTKRICITLILMTIHMPEGRLIRHSKTAL